MALSDAQRAFLEANTSAAMITIGSDGQAKVARVGTAVIDGKLWSSGTADRARTKRLRADPRCTLYVHEAAFAWLALETEVRILDGPDAPQLHVMMFRQTQKRPTGKLAWFGGELDEDEFVQKMIDEGRLVYEFDIKKAYGLTPG